MAELNPDHPMTRLFRENQDKLLALTIWALRKHIKNLMVEITLDDMVKFGSIGFTSMTVRGKEKSIELQIVDAATGHAVAISEDASLDNPAAVQMAQFVEMKKNAPGVVARLKAGDHDAVAEAISMLELWGNEKKFE